MHLVLVAALNLLACSGTETPAPATLPETAPTAPVAEAPTAPAAAPASTVSVVSVVSGDAACYVELKAADGATTTYSSDFELCPGGSKDATPLIGKSVAATFETITVQSPECQGDPACTKTVEAQGVATLTP